jgi:hypothetical protein
MTIAAPSVCMQCHSAIKADSPAIQKLAQYAAENKPVPWVRIYEIPAYVDFSHRAHIAAKNTCEDCHGKVAERDALYREVGESAESGSGGVPVSHLTVGQLADGTLVMPVQGRSARGEAESWGSFSTVMTSRDHGATWTVATPAHSFGSESQAVQLGDGSIMLNIRNETEGEFYNYRAVFVTHDLGQTWHPHGTNLNTLIDPNCNASLLRVDYVEASKKKHVLLFANPHSKVKRVRTNHTIQVSFDDGRTWPQEYHLLLDQGNGWGYPSMSRIDDQHIGIVYAGSQADLVFQALSLDELLKR